MTKKTVGEIMSVMNGDINTIIPSRPASRNLVKKTVHNTIREVIYALTNEIEGEISPDYLRKRANEIKQFSV